MLGCSCSALLSLTSVLPTSLPCRPRHTMDLGLGHSWGRAGSRESKGAVHKLVQPGSMGSTSDSVKARCKCPCLIVRPAVRPLHPRPRLAWPAEPTCSSGPSQGRPDAGTQLGLMPASLQLFILRMKGYEAPSAQCELTG